MSWPNRKVPEEINMRGVNCANCKHSKPYYLFHILSLGFESPYNFTECNHPKVKWKYAATARYGEDGLAAAAAGCSYTGILFEAK